MSVPLYIGPDRLAEYLETSSKEAQAVAETFLCNRQNYFLTLCTS